MCWSTPYDADWLHAQRRRTAPHGSAPFAFWTALMHLLSNLAEQPVAKNLLVTAAITKLARFPHPVMHAFLFSPNSLGSGDGDDPAQMKCTLRGQIKLLVAKLAEIEKETVGFALELQKVKDKSNKKAASADGGGGGSNDGGGDSGVAETVGGAVSSLFRTPSKAKPSSSKTTPSSKSRGAAAAAAAAAASPSTPSTGTGFFSSMLGSVKTARRFTYTRVFSRDGSLPPLLLMLTCFQTHCL